MIIRRSWYDLLKGETEKQYFKKLQSFLANERQNFDIFPTDENVFSALNLLPYDKVKVVIIGQDPYHEPNQAHGLAFSVLDPTPLPPSLINIYKEIEADLNIKCLNSGNLTRWEKQGVLLLNTTLTVRRSQAMSHQGKGWEEFTSKIIKLLAERKEPMVFMLWGSHAGQFASMIPNRHLVLRAPHPSPLSAYRGFFGCKHFSKCNKFLVDHNLSPINWE